MHEDGLLQTTQNFLHSLGNYEGEWGAPIVFLLSLLSTLILKLILKVVATSLRRYAHQTATRWDDVAVDLIDGTKAIVLFAWIFYSLLPLLEPSLRMTKVTQVCVVLLSAYQVIIWGLHVIRNWKETYLQAKVGEDASAASVMGLLYTAIQGVFLLTIILISLSNVGVDIGALLTGLGVGGIAVALAAQNVLGDLLASLSIILDKPFLVGDFIVVDKEAGTIERIGVKTTRVRALSGEEVVFSNKDLLEHRIHNYKSMQVRRVVQSFGVTYETPQEILETIPTWVKTIVQNIPQVKFDRCHFANYGDSSLNYELVFYVNDPDYTKYMDLQQSILFAIMKKFSKEKVDFAYPVQRLYMADADVSSIVGRLQGK